MSENLYTYDGMDEAIDEIQSLREEIDRLKSQISLMDEHVFQPLRPILKEKASIEDKIKEYQDKFFPRTIAAFGREPTWEVEEESGRLQVMQEDHNNLTTEDRKLCTQTAKELEKLSQKMEDKFTKVVKAIREKVPDWFEE